MAPADRQDRGALWLTALAMVAFAGNSLLCRLALRPGWIDAPSFSLVRIAAGAGLLLALSARQRGVRGTMRLGSLLSGAALAGYAVFFSFAYVSLDAATGALTLFATVQATMLVAALLHGERPSRTVWFGFLLAGAGLCVLLLPGASAPDPLGLVWMALAGIAWGVYSLRGRRQDAPTATTAANFVLAVPFCLLASAICLPNAPVVLEPRGVLVAASSGAITSGLGYVVWYAAVRRLEATTAAMVQLTVPVLAAGGGIACFGEEPTLRLLLAASLSLGGTALVVLGRSRRSR